MRHLFKKTHHVNEHIGMHIGKYTQSVNHTCTIAHIHIFVCKNLCRHAACNFNLIHFSAQKNFKSGREGFHWHYISVIIKLSLQERPIMRFGQELLVQQQTGVALLFRYIITNGPSMARLRNAAWAIFGLPGICK